jgi:ribosomal-protein-alanine N-acetyltransferase
MKFPQLETERLILREHRLDQADQLALFHIFSDEEVTRYYNVPTFRDVEEALPFLKRRINRFWTQKGIRWAITFKGDDTLIGSCGFNSWSRRNRVGELGYELARPYWNRGIMTEAVLAAVAYGFESMDLNRIEAWVIPGNVASARVLQKAGFHAEGIMRQKGYWGGQFHDLEMFSLLHSDQKRVHEKTNAETRRR